MSKVGKLSKAVLALALALVMIAGVSIYAEDNGAQEETGFVSSKYGAKIPSWAVGGSRRFSYDFSETSSSFYSGDGGFRILGASGFEIYDGALTCAIGKSFALLSEGYLGDDYGLGGGYLSFRLNMTGGSFKVVLRDTGDNPARTDNYLNFEFHEDGSVDIGDASGKNTPVAAAATGIFSENSAPVIRIEDRVNKIYLYVDGKLAASVDYVETGDATGEYSVSNYESRIVVRDRNGNILGTREKSEIQRAGRFLLSFSRFDGYIDDLEFEHTDIDQSLPAGDKRPVDYSNWVATDDLGRTTPLNETTGDPVSDKSVGIFYFLCWTGAGIHVQDNTRLFLELGLNDFQKYLSKQGGEAYWAEPYFGYYRNTDTWVYRKHAYMLDAAGIDFIFLDISNGVTFPEGHLKLLDTWLKIRQEGGSTPDVCFLCGDTPELFERDLLDLRKNGAFTPENLEKYSELFFKWNGKPLIFGNPSMLSQKNKTFLEDFEVRGCWAWENRDGYWNWIEELDQDENGNLYMYKGRDENGVFEELAVALGHHPASSKGRSFVLGRQNTNGLQNFEFYLDTTPLGTGFASQAEYALKESPRCILITGWNEWIAGNSRGGNMFMANTPVNNVNYVDQFNPEFSRDGEPMKIRDGVGFGDNYYYQIVDFVRRYKGMDKVKKAENQENFDAAGAMSPGTEAFDGAWADVGPEYRDTIGDAEFRKTSSYDAAFKYLNATGRNDLESAKVCQDGENLYFTVKTVHDIEVADDTCWMNLFIDMDSNHDTGWEGYDYVINRSRNGGAATVEKLEKGSYKGTVCGTAEIAFSGNRFTLKVPKSSVGIAATGGINFDFKWADNSTETGNVMSFMDLGDTAPNDRFNFRFVGDSVKYERENATPAPGSKSGRKGCGGAGCGAAVIAAALAAFFVCRRLRRE